ncbi:malonyl-CoA decarboxylase, mitochondrial-like isoform X2 [Argiope bruennichi]|nr:malonyl-CoA decarboxylase, mitochondrial-like isoform X2 [Argiope bruennichi]XP_055943955.1 malonyl-CoA decarboxylase, mitochondrial-like isoform X2 [Argiope bruennichi]XP_055943956.1 malonyl-CoA decarboxylase, mitochondrial-like isoform X2 [Argiope bruennichi]XP_055943957.1 malonyl-CoA decarboxylase, mitochondrial-like isoform X2 [Argiope bruennichi]KAF8778112.1 Malonyl-CoA decarboxylase like protein [Argiope bruennichi]
MISSLKTPLDFIVHPSEMPLESKAYEFCKQYVLLSADQKLDVLKEMSVKYNFDQSATGKAAESYITSQNKGTGVILKAADRLKSSLNPSYAYAFNRIRKLDGGVKFIVDVRADILKMLPSLDFNDEATHHLKTLNNYVKEILSFSFNVGFMKLERITWDSSCYMLEKISQYEAVHPVRSWTDIKQRVGPYRRCYVFTHSCMPREPIVVLHTALTSEISSSIASIVRQTKARSSSEDSTVKFQNDIENPKEIKAAIFYSITSTQKGLHGIELGNQLIKKVVKEVLAEFPHITQLSSLSPIPGFRDWFLMEIKKMRGGSSVISSFFSEKDQSVLKNVFSAADQQSLWSSLQSLVASNQWIHNEDLKELLKTPLMKICAHYLYSEKRRSNALNSVAHFHLRNGAVMWRLNWLADLSPRGLDNSCGMMVNYRYYLDETEFNSKNYVENYIVTASDDFKNLLIPALSKSSL